MIQESKPALAPASGTKRQILAWCLYDWANTAYSTIVVTFVFSTYFTKEIAEDGGTAWSYGSVASALLIALLAPLAGAVADRSGRRMPFLVTTTLLAIGGMCALALAPAYAEGASLIVLCLVLYVISNVTFEVGMVFYNSFLVTIAPSGMVGRISGLGWALGYFGGLGCMAVVLLGCIGSDDAPGFFGFTREGDFHIRSANLVAAAWFLVFSLPLFFFVRDPGGTPRGGIDLRGAFRDLGETARQVRRYRQVIRLLLARLVYNDGLVTIFAFGGIYAATSFDMTPREVLLFGIVLNVAAGIGTLLGGWFDDLIGGKKTIAFSLVALFASVLLATFAQSETWLWVSGVLIGLFVGPNQASSRSLLSRFTPERHRSEFFGFFAFSGKATAFLGPLFYGQAVQYAELAGWSEAARPRAGIAMVLVFFAIGLILLLRVNEPEGMEAATLADAEATA